MHKFLEASVEDHMTKTVVTVPRDMTMRELHKKFEEFDFNAFPVDENGNVVGLVTKFDCLKCFAFSTRRMLPDYENLMTQTVEDVMTPDFIYVDPETKLTRVLQLVLDHRIRSIPVLDAGQRLAGIIAREDLIRALAKAAPV